MIDPLVDVVVVKALFKRFDGVDHIGLGLKSGIRTVAPYQMIVLGITATGRRVGRVDEMTMLKERNSRGL